MERGDYVNELERALIVDSVAAPPAHILENLDDEFITHII